MNAPPPPTITTAGLPVRFNVPLPLLLIVNVCVIDSRHMQSECGKSVDNRLMPSQQVLDKEATAVLVAWANKMYNEQNAK